MCSKQIRVTFLATLPLNSSTIIGRTIPLATELQKRGHDVNLITLGKTTDISENQSIPTKIAGPTFRIDSKKPYFFQLISRYVSAKNGLRLALNEQETDVVVLVKPHPQNYSAIKKIPVPFILDSDDEEKYSSRTNYLEKVILGSIDKHASKKSQLITACSPFLVAKYKQICPNKPVEFIPTAISNETSTDFLDLRRYFDLDSNSQIILYLGSLSISSGHRIDQILNIWNEISTQNLKLHLILAGDGIDADIIRARAKLLSNNNRIHFFGRFDNNLADCFTRQANLLVDPVDNSITNQAKSSSRTLQALKNGTPIVTGNVGIRNLLIPESLHNWALYDPNNPITLVNNIKYGLTDEAKTIFRDNTKDNWKQWTWDVVGAKFSSLIEELTL
jgi:glycosyltransferase involved in cell wall biosynthesis